MQKKHVIFLSVVIIPISVASLSHNKPFLLQQRYVITFDRTPHITPLIVEDEAEALCLVCHDAQILSKKEHGDLSDCSLQTSEKEHNTVLKLVYPAKDYVASYYHVDTVNGAPAVVIELRSKHMLEQLNSVSSPVLWYS